MDPSHPFRLGGRFLKGRTLSHFVTRAAAAGVAVGTAAMVLVLSAFNGLEELVLATYKNVHPEVSLVHTEGARFELSKEMAERLDADHALRWIPFQEQKALLRNAQREMLVTLVGMPRPLWPSHPWLDSLSSQTIQEPTMPQSAALGYGVALQMGILQLSGREGMELLWPGTSMGFDLASSFKRHVISPEIIFFVHPQIDQSHVLVDLNTLQGWTQDPRIDGIQIWGGDVDEVLATLGPLASNLDALSPEDKEAALFRVMRSEGLITTGILAFIVLLASLGLYSATVLLGLEKTNQRAILRAMGMSNQHVRRSFWWSAVWVSAIGGILGCLLGAALVAGQSAFGWVRLGSGYVVEAYPVSFHLSQCITVLGFVVCVGGLLGWGATARLNSPLDGLRSS